MEKKNSHSSGGKLYCIEPERSTVREKTELFTWNDACEVIEHYQASQPEDRLVIREFEPI